MALSRTAVSLGPHGADLPSIPLPRQFGSPYQAGSHGYDGSYPQCTDLSAPGPAAFAVVGLNGGRVFTTNPCFAEIIGGAPGTPAIYLNSGLSLRSPFPGLSTCYRLAAALDLEDRAQIAYALGCSAARQSLAELRSRGLSLPVMWWVDVELGNSWQRIDLELNRYAIRGQVDQLAMTERPVGVYSSFRDWQRITGGWSYPLISANWVAAKPVAEACAGPGFSGAPVWLAQEVDPWTAGGWDSDWAC